MIMFSIECILGNAHKLLRILVKLTVEGVRLISVTALIRCLLTVEQDKETNTGFRRLSKKTVKVCSVPVVAPDTVFEAASAIALMQSPSQQERGFFFWATYEPLTLTRKPDP